MIVVDTSALIAICLDETAADACAAALDRETSILISAGTLAEALIVAASRGVDQELDRLLVGLPIAVIPVTAETARRAGAAYRRWGKGRHPASLNLGDCFAYALAAERGCPLLFIGNDFTRTDIVSAIA